MSGRLGHGRGDPGDEVLGDGVVGRVRVVGLQALAHVPVEGIGVRVALVVEIDLRADHAERVDQVRPGTEEQPQALLRAGFDQRTKDTGDQARRVESFVDRVDGHREPPAPHPPEQVGRRIRADAHRPADGRENLGRGQTSRVDAARDAGFGRDGVGGQILHGDRSPPVGVAEHQETGDDRRLSRARSSGHHQRAEIIGALQPAHEVAQGRLAADEPPAGFGRDVHSTRARQEVPLQVGQPQLVLLDPELGEQVQAVQLDVEPPIGKERQVGPATQQVERDRLPPGTGFVRVDGVRDRQGRQITRFVAS